MPDRFWNKVHMVPCGGCWLWTGALKPTGYGVASAGLGSSTAAHRLAYESEVGPIPAGLEIDHLCRNRACVNPMHMEVVTHAENLRRARAHRNLEAANLRRKTKPLCPQGHEYSTENTYIRPSGWRECRTCRADREATRPARSQQGRRRG